MLSTVVTDVVGVLSSASSLFIVAAGLTLVFGAMRLINIAHGSFYMYGAFFATTLGAWSLHAGFWVALIASPVLAGLMGCGVEVLVLRRLYAREHLTQLLATFALLLIFADLALRFWGKGVRGMSAPSVVQGHFRLAGAPVPYYDLVIIGAALLVGSGLWLLLAHTSLGWMIRAVVDDVEVLAVSGVNVRLLYTGVFALGALLAGLSGVIIAPQQAVEPGMDAQIIVAAFIVAVIGGLGSITGAAIGALIIGIVQTLGAVWAPSWASTFIYLLMIVVLAVRPWGLLGSPER
ncbi:MAG: branched-chain amino acid ABC transporter permease [Jatrophihabitans sp.]|nr:MAG: branched-chain amino acid ABC transporter permease [Jatrophihabitans sp.]